MYRLAVGFVVALELIVRYIAQVQVRVFVDNFVWGCKLSLVVAVSIPSFQPIFLSLMLDWLFSSCCRCISSVLEHAGWSVMFQSVFILFVGAVIVCWKGNGSEISLLCIISFSSVVEVCSVLDTAIWILFLNMLSNEPFL